MNLADADSKGGAWEERARVDDAFPGRIADIERARCHSPSFRELVDDFLECDRILGQIKAEGTAANPRLPDYEEMWNRLEEEILTWLAKNRSGARATPGRESQR